MNKTNMLILSDYLMSRADELKDHFNMSKFLIVNGRSYDVTAGPRETDLPVFLNEPNVCGTSACAVGYAPAVIPTVPDDYSEFNRLRYLAYSERVFMEAHLESWNFCFSGRWTAVDNTIEGAAFRLSFIADNSDQEGEVFKPVSILFDTLLNADEDTLDEYAEEIEQYDELKAAWLNKYYKSHTV